MRSHFYGLEVAKSALQAHQAAINVTGHNIANSSTVGYTRQDPDFQQRVTQPGGPFVPPHFKSLGGGVDIEDIRRLRDRFIDIQIRQESRTGAFWKTIDEGLERIEVFFSEPMDGGLSKVFDRFWDTWQDLSKFPESQATRALVIETADILTGAFRQVSDQLHLYQEQMNDQLSIKVNDVNSIIDQVFALNQQISRMGNVGGNTNDLKDKLDVLVDNLSKLMDFQVKDNDNGTYTLVMQGRILASDKTVTHLEVRENRGSRMNEIFIEGSDDPFLEKYQNGELKAILEFRDEVIPDYIVFLDDMARGMVENINLLHRGGYTLEHPPQTGLNFFEKIDSSKDFTAENIRVNQEIFDDWKKVAASVSGAPGDGENAIGISRIRERSMGGWNTANSPVYNPNSTTFDIRVGTATANQTINIREFIRVDELVKDINLQIAANSELDGKVRAYTDGVGLYFSAQPGEELHFDTPGPLADWGTVVSFVATDTMMINGVSIDFTGVTSIRDLADAINTNTELGGSVLASVDGTRLKLHAQTRDPLTVRGTAANLLNLVTQSANPNEAYRGRIAQLGAERQEARRIASNQELLVDQLDIRKESVSGVSLDEEMTNLIKYQHAYDAAAMLTRVIDEMLDTIINRLR